MPWTEYITLAEMKDGGNTDSQEGVSLDDLWLILYLIKKPEKIPQIVADQYCYYSDLL